MIGGTGFCCWSIQRAVRFIGIVTLVTNVLVLVALMADAKKVLSDDKIRIFFGFDSQFFELDNLTAYYTDDLRTPSNKCTTANLSLDGQPETDLTALVRAYLLTFAEWFPLFCLVYALVTAVSSALLVGASVAAQRWLTIPWLICSIFNVVCHFTSLLMLSFYRLPSASEWVTALTVLYSVTLLYFTLVVTIAHYLWWMQSRKKENNPSPRQMWQTNINKSSPLFESLTKIKFDDNLG